MRNLKICVFAYEFPHFKSEYGIKTLLANGFEIAVVIAQPFKKLNVPRSSFKISPTLPVNGDLQAMCKINNIRYEVTEHDSNQATDAIAATSANLGVILGARILKKTTIKKLKYGILNIHPGAIPENRGLDNFKWSIVNKLRLANTAHLIDEKIDKGDILRIRDTKVLSTDGIYDLYLRHFFSEFSLLVEALNDFTIGNDILIPVASNGTYFSAVPSDIDQEFEKYFSDFIKKFGQR